MSSGNPIEFRILDASDPDQRREWLDLLEQWPDREPWASPVLGELFAHREDRVLAAVGGTGAGGIVFPLLARPLSREHWIPTDHPLSSRKDVTSPYGYGGPFRWGDEPSSDAFWDGLDRWAGEEGIVSLVGRLSLFPEQLSPFRGRVREVLPNVVRRVDLDPEDIWMDYRHKVRKNVKKARRSGVEVWIETESPDLDSFLNVYESTMERRDADEGYLFSREFFESIVQGMPGEYAFVHAGVRGEIVSTELVLLSPSHVYSFLGGTYRESFDIRPNDLLKHELALWARKTGRTAYVLGGGYDGRDGIFRYKKSFAPGGETPFRIGSRVYDEDAYQSLIDLRREHEDGGAGGWGPGETHFPAYRSP